MQGNRNDIGSKIRKYRTERGLTQQNLASDINYSDKVISKWERSESIPDAGAMKILAEYFGLTLDELINDKPQNENFNYIEKTFKISDYKLPLICLQCFTFMLTVLFTFEIFALIEDSTLPILTFTKYISLVFIVIALLDIVFVYAKLNRMPVFISFLISAFVALIGGIIDYIEYGADPEYLIVHPNIVLRLALTSLFVIFVNFFVANAIKNTSNSATSMANVVEEKNTPLSTFRETFIIQIVSICLLMLTYICFSFNTVEIDIRFPIGMNIQYEMWGVSEFAAEYSNGFDFYLNSYQVFFGSESAVAIIAGIIFILLSLWDVFYLVFDSVLHKANILNKLEKIIEPIILIVSSVLFIIFYIITMLLLINSSGYSEITIDVYPLIGNLAVSLCVMGMIISRIINAVLMLRKRRVNI